MVKQIIFLAIAAGLVTGCETVSSEPADRPALSSASERQQDDRLSARVLKDGECGLFVFSVDTDPGLILFSDNIGNYGVWASGSEEVRLSIEDASGEPALGQYPVQTFKTPVGQTLSLSLIVGDEMDQGVRFPTGTLKVSDPEGWERITPVSAWAACQVSES